MSWLIKHAGVEFNSDDFLIDDLAEIERATGVSWLVANPWRDVKVARAFLAAAMLRCGRGEEEVEAALNLLTLKQLGRAFTYVKGDDEPAGEDGDEVPLDRSSRGSSSGGRGKGGYRAKSASSA